MHPGLSRLLSRRWLLGAALLSSFSCTTAVRGNPFRVEITGPGGLPMQCRLPDCALPGEFTSVDEAVFAGFDVIRRQPDWKLREYAGCVWEERLGVYRTSYPAPKTKDLAGSSSRCFVPPPPAGRQLVATYHNHPTKERFSQYDVPAKVAEYLLAPSGTSYRYTPQWTFEKWENGRWIRSEAVAPGE